MSYQAIITKLTNIRPHPNGDRISLASAMNFQVIVGKDVSENTIGVFFESDGCLSHEMCHQNNLYIDSDLNKDKTKRGFFDKNRRIRAQNFRGERSYGFWIELKSIEWTGVDIKILEEGFTFTILNGKEVCRKYINPATLHRAQKNKSKNRNSSTKIRKRFEQFKEHFDTKHLRYEISKIPKGSILYLSEKTHGTSGRTGNLYGKLPLTSTQVWWNRYFWWLKKFENKKEYQHVTGTRRVVIPPDASEDGGYYSGKTFRIKIHNKIKEIVLINSNSKEERGLPKGITIFYEIVGFDETSKPLMNKQSIDKISDKKIRKLIKNKYGDEMVYSYNCNPKDPDIHARYDVFVYRATITNKDGTVFELSWLQVKNLCELLNLKHVPELRNLHFYNDTTKNGQEALLAMVEKFLDQDSVIDPTHITEGVCVRIETPNGSTYILKEKGFIFKVLEGIVHSNPNKIDIEEAESLKEEEV